MCRPMSQHLEFYTINSWIVYTLSSFLPSITMILCTVPIGVKLYQSSGDSASNLAQKQALKNANILVLVTSLSYLSLTLPTAIAIPFHTFGAFQLPAHFMYVAFICFVLNHSINFFLYVATGSVFRRELKLLFTKRK